MGNNQIQDIGAYYIANLLKINTVNHPNFYSSLEHLFLIFEDAEKPRSSQE